MLIIHFIIFCVMSSSVVVIWIVFHSYFPVFKTQTTNESVNYSNIQEPLDLFIIFPSDNLFVGLRNRQQNQSSQPTNQLTNNPNQFSQPGIGWVPHTVCLSYNIIRTRLIDLPRYHTFNIQQNFTQLNFYNTQEHSLWIWIVLNWTTCELWVKEGNIYADNVDQ